MILRLVQDDDVTVREYISEVVSRVWSNGVPVSDRRSVEMISKSLPTRDIEDDRMQLGESCAMCVRPSGPLTILCRRGRSTGAGQPIVTIICGREAQYFQR